jgi:hypothetical protein
MPPGIANLAENASLDVDICGVMPRMTDIGITTALSHVVHQLFVAGLKPAIEDEIMKAMTVLLWDAFQQAITLEKIHMLHKVNLPMVNEIDNDQDTTKLEGEIKTAWAQLN